MQPLVLSDDEVQQLQSIANSRSLPHAIVQRAQIVLVPGVNYLGGSRQLRRRVPPLSPPAMAGGGDSEN